MLHCEFCSMMLLVHSSTRVTLIHNNRRRTEFTKMWIPKWNARFLFHNVLGPIYYRNKYTVYISVRVFLDSPQLFRLLKSSKMSIDSRLLRAQCFLGGEYLFNMDVPSTSFQRQSSQRAVCLTSVNQNTLNPSRAHGWMELLCVTEMPGIFECIFIAREKRPSPQVCLSGLTVLWNATCQRLSLSCLTFLLPTCSKFGDPGGLNWIPIFSHLLVMHSNTLANLLR